MILINALKCQVIAVEVAMTVCTRDCLPGGSAGPGCQLSGLFHDGASVSEKAGMKILDDLRITTILPLVC